ncbi:MAG: flagellar hook-basal body protein, partial [Spirochaetota bacterium]|nr:flagellar hook-basal body protein [Spirochaetota bacterium]
MVRGLYTGVSGMLSEWHRMDVVANNLANLNTTGFKRDDAIFKSFPEMLIRRLDDNGVVKVPNGSYDIAPFVGKMGTGVELNEVYTRHEQGIIRNTGNDFDLALDGKGYFVVKTDRGDRYTRNGSFLIDKDGFLV